MPKADLWRSRFATAKAMAMLVLARLLVSLVPLRHWRESLGCKTLADSEPPGDSLRFARTIAQSVERAAWRLPFETKCLPRAMALSWLLSRRCVPHCVVLAIRPPNMRDSADSLHAWVESGGTIILGDLPGPWHVVYRSGETG